MVTTLNAMSSPMPVDLPAADRAFAPIHQIRGQSVVLDDAIAALFGVETRRLNEQVRRNAARFEGYAFQLTAGEITNLISQNATSSSWGGRRKHPWAFTEHGVVMAATVLKSDAAIAAMKMVVEVFVSARRKPDTSRQIANDVGVGNGLIPRLTQAMAAVLDSVVNQHQGTSVREEAQDLLDRSIAHLKDRLSRAGLENEELAARATKLLAEAEASKATAAKTQAEAGEIELRVLARKLQLVIEAERAMTGGDIDRFVGVLERLGG